MIEGLSVPWSEMGVVTLVVIFAIGLGTGRLFTKRQYDDAIHDRDEWRAESRIKDQQLATKDEQIDEKDKQLQHMGEVGRTVDAIMRALQRSSREETQ